MRKRPLLAMGLFSFFMALAAKYIPSLAVALMLAVSAFALVGAICLRNEKWAKPMAFAAAGIVLVGMSFLVKMNTDVLSQTAYDGRCVNVTMRVLEATSSRGTYLVEVLAGDVEEGVRMTLPLLNDNIAPKAGDLLSGDVVLSARTDDYAKANDAYLRADAQALSWEDGAHTLSKPTAMLYKWRDYIHDLWYRHMSFDSGAVCDAITFGNRSLLEDTIADSFRVSGIYHMLCVSGMHLSILVGVIWRFFRRGCCLRPRTTAILSMAAVVLFAALCGFSSSVNRAVVMVFIMLASTMFRRRADGLNSLGLAAGVLLLFDPFAVCDLGFVLTFVSTLGILLVLPVWERAVTARVRAKCPHVSAVVCPLVTAVGVSVSAMLFVQPILSLYFGTFSLYFLVGNLLCGMVSTVLLVLCLLSILISLAMPNVAHILLTWCDAICRWMIACSEVIAALPFSSVSSDRPFLLVWQFALPVMVVVLYRLRRVRVTVTACGAAVALFAVIVTGNRLLSQNTLTIRTVSADNTAVVVEAPDSIGILFEGNGEDLSESVRMVREMGHDRIDWMIWLEHGGTHCVDTSGMILPVTNLMTVDAPETYVELPKADTVTALSRECTVSFGADGIVERIKGWFVLTYRGTTVAIADEFSDAADLLPYHADAVLLSEYVPYHPEWLEATHTVVFCQYAYREYWETTFLSDFYYASQVNELTTEGNGEIDLRLA